MYEGNGPLFTVGPPGYKRHVHLDLEHGCKSCLQGRGWDDVLFSVPHPEVRVACLGLLWLGRNLDLGITRLLGVHLQKTLQRRIVTWLGSVRLRGCFKYPF